MGRRSASAGGERGREACLLEDWGREGIILESESGGWPSTAEPHGGPRRRMPRSPTGPARAQAEPHGARRDDLLYQIAEPLGARVKKLLFPRGPPGPASCTRSTRRPALGEGCAPPGSTPSPLFGRCGSPTASPLGRRRWGPTPSAYEGAGSLAPPGQLGPLPLGCPIIRAGQGVRPSGSTPLPCTLESTLISMRWVSLQGAEERWGNGECAPFRQHLSLPLLTNSRRGLPRQAVPMPQGLPRETAGRDP
jgi:hypothetical protein